MIPRVLRVTDHKVVHPRARDPWVTGSAGRQNVHGLHNEQYVAMETLKENKERTNLVVMCSWRHPIMRVGPCPE